MSQTKLEDLPNHLSPEDDVDGILDSVLGEYLNPAPSDDVADDVGLFNGKGKSALTPDKKINHRSPEEILASGIPGMSECEVQAILDTEAEVLLARQRELSEKYDQASLQTEYAEIRDEYSSCQLALNSLYQKGVKGIPAPAFRPRLSRAKDPLGGQIHLSNDTQLIDLHFLHGCGHRLADNSHGKKAIGTDEFVLDEAELFIGTAGKLYKKRQILGLDSCRTSTHIFHWGLDSIKDSSAKQFTRKCIKNFEKREKLLNSKKLSAKVDRRLWAALTVAEDILNESGHKCSPENLMQATRLLIGSFDTPQRTLVGKLKQAKEALRLK